MPETEEMTWAKLQRENELFPETERKPVWKLISLQEYTASREIRA